MLYSIPLHDLVTIKAQANNAQAVRSTLRIHFSTKMGLRPNQTGEQHVFFRQNLQSTTCAEAYAEWCELRQSDSQSSLHLVVKFHPAVIVRETDWFPLIRYCLKTVSGPNAASVVFTQPQKNQPLDLFIQPATTGLATDFSAEEQSLIYQMMALQIALYFEKPLYTHPVVPLPPSATIWQLENYMNSAVYQVLTNQRVPTLDDFQRLLVNRYQIRTQAQVRNNRFVRLQLRYQSGGWVSPTHSGLSLRDINKWLVFNRRLAHSTSGENILGGPYRSSSWLNN